MVFEDGDLTVISESFQLLLFTVVYLHSTGIRAVPVKIVWWPN